MAITTQMRTDVSGLYVALFGRAPDSEGLGYWVQQLDQGKTLVEVADAMYGTAPARAYYPAYLTNQEIISNFYLNVLGRPADAEGLAYWTGRLDEPGATPGSVIAAIIDVVANYNGTDPAGIKSAKWFENKVDVAEYFAIKVGTVDGSKDVLAAVTDDATTVTAAKAVVDGVGVAGQTFTLTANADTVVGGAGNDLIIANEHTLSSADRINGGGGVDELKLSSNSYTHYSAFEMNGVEKVTVTADNWQTQTFDMSGSTGVNLLKSLNSTGNVNFREVTEISNLEVNNLTDGADFTVAFQDAVVSGSADTVALAMVKNGNANTNIITVGSETVANGGVETINVTVSGANTTIGQLDSNISTLGVAGDRNLTITHALNSTVDKVSAGSFTGALNINLTGNVAAAGEGSLSITTGSGNDVIDLLSGSAANTAPEANDLATVTRNAVINTGAGNDTVEAGLGDDTIDLGAGDDTLIFTKGGLTVLDTINGGAGVDTIILNTADTITKSEAENVSDIENFTMTAAGTLLQVSDRMVTSLTGSNTFTVNMGVGGNVVDLTQVTFSNTNRVKVNGTTGNDVVLVNDATLNAKATIAFGQDGFGAANQQAGSVDTLVVIGNGTTTVTSDDFSNITGLDQLTLTSDSSRAQTFNITINSAMIDTKDSTDFSVGDTVDELVIYLDRNLAQGSVVNLDASALTASQLITIRGNSNVTVNVISSGAGTVSQVSSLEFTENADFLTSPGNATYTADSLDQLDHADVVNAQGTADTLQLKFAVANAAANLDDMFNNFSDTGGTLEAVYFNTNNAVQFNDITTSALLSGVKTVTTGNGDDVVAGNTKAATFNLGNGNNSYTSATIGVVSEKVNTGTGVDTFTFKTSQLGATDSITAGTGRDVLNLTDDSVMAPGVYALMTAALSGVDTVNYTVGHVNDGLTVNNAAVMQSEAGLQVNVVDNSGSNTEIIFDASAVTAGHSVTVSVTGSGSGFGNHVLPLWTTFRPDVIGGAGNDTITIGGTVSSYVVQGNAGADTIHITTPNAVGILFNSPNDGAASGSNTGYDVITGFTSGADYVIFDQTGFNIVNALPQTPGAVLTRSYDSAVIFDPLGGTPPFISRDALVMTHAGTGLTDAEIVDLSAVAARANGIGITALTNAGGIIVAQGQTQSAIYLFREEDLFQDNVSTHELKLLGVVDTNQFGNAAGDMVFA